MAEEFKMQLVREEKEKVLVTHTKVAQANTLCRELGLNRHYTFEDKPAPGAEGDDEVTLGSRALKVSIVDGKGRFREASLPMFFRELERLQAQVEAQRKSRAGAGIEDASVDLSAAKAGGGTHGRPPGAGPSSGAAGGGKGKGGPAPAVGDAQREKKATKLQIQADLRAVLADTAQLTKVLQRQLAELHEKGWNRGGKQLPV